MQEGKAWIPLHIRGTLANSADHIRANIESALVRDYLPFNVLLNTKGGAVAIVGSGPSLKDTWPLLKDFDGEIIACNAACQFLLEKGITPQFMFCFDADPLMLEFITANKEITYLLASRCPPKAFDMVEGCQVICWHAAGDEDVEELLLKHKRHEPMIVGGGAAVTRAMVVAIPMGYRTIHIFGGDSSFANGETHIRQSTTVERVMPIKCAGRTFVTAPWMAKQVEDFKLLAKMYKKLGVEFIMHGDGLLQHVAKELGFATDYENAIQRHIRIAAREFKHRATILWQHV